MKRINYIIKQTLLIFFVPLCLFAQKDDSQQITIPLSNPARAGALIIDHYKGSIRVTGYDGDVVVVNAALRFKPQRKTSNGMKRISENSLQLSAREKNNEVTVESNSQNKTIDLDIMVPYAFSLNIHNSDNGDISLNNLQGEMEIANINGDIVVYNLSGSAILNTVDGNITVDFKKVTPNVPMVFSSVEGKIDVALPAGVNARIKMKSDNGEIFTDFPMLVNKREHKTEHSAKSGVNRVYIDDWTYGTINKGGPEYLFKSYNGSIFIRKK